MGVPSYYQFDPYSETLVGLDAQTNERIPRLAESWSFTPDGREWTFNLVQGAMFHDGYGEFTSTDAVFALDRITGEDSQASAASFFNGASWEAADEYTLKVQFPTIALDTVAILSRGFGGGEIMMLSKKQFDEVGVEGFDAEPAGTGSYEYGGRTSGQNIWFEKAPGPHWRGENPDFQEVELRWVREDLTRLAALLTGEIHVAALSRELQLEASRRGMESAEAGVPTNYLTMFLGGQYYVDEYAADFDPNVPWANPETGILVRQAMNKRHQQRGDAGPCAEGSGRINAHHPILPRVVPLQSPVGGGLGRTVRL